jgi:hypothetical protein
MTNAHSEPTNLVLEQLRLMLAETNAMRAETNARFDDIQRDFGARFDRIEADITDIKKDMRGFKLNTIAEIYKANLTVASFADHERRIEALERKMP